MRRRRADDLFDRIATFGALCAAASRAAAGKRRGPGPAAFLANLETEVLALERELRAGTWRPGGYVSFEVRDPKRRMISAAPFRDRVVHHAVHAVIAPLFERGFIGHTYANRAGKGTHRAVARYEWLRDRHRHVLRGDIYRYFPAIDHEVLKADLRRRIACQRTLVVLDRIVDASNPQELVHLYYPGDDLFTPFERRRGSRAVPAVRRRLRAVRRRPGPARGVLPIGNLTSQLFANVYLDRFDHFVTEVRRDRAAAFLARRRLSLHPAKTYVAATSDPATFLGFELRPGGRRRLPEANVRRFRNRLRGLRDRWRAGTVTRGEVEQRVRAWVAHAAHASTWRLRRAIFRGGWFASRGQPVPGA